LVSATVADLGVVARLCASLPDRGIEALSPVQTATTADAAGRSRRLQTSSTRFGPDPARRGRTQAVLDGQVKSYDPRRGFGFIARDEHDVFVHRLQLAGVGARESRNHRRVRFEVGRGPKGDEIRKVLAV
jgi:cold shock CspA family protein